MGARPAHVLRKGGRGGPFVSCWSLRAAQWHHSRPPRPHARLCSGPHLWAGAGAAQAGRMGRAGEGVRGHAPEDRWVDTSEASGGQCPALAGGLLGQVHHGARRKSSSVPGWGARGMCADPRQGPAPPLCTIPSSSESDSRPAAQSWGLSPGPLRGCLPDFLLSLRPPAHGPSSPSPAVPTGHRAREGGSPAPGAEAGREASEASPDK